MSATPSTRPEALAPLRFHPFRWLVLGATINRLGSSIAPLALAFAVLDFTHSAADLGIVVGSRSLANLVFLLLGGALADRLPRGLVLAGSSTASALTQAAVALVLLGHANSVPLLAGLSALNGAVAAISGPASAGLIPLTVPREVLKPANALSRLFSNGASVAGTAAAGLLVATLGSGAAIAADAGTYAAAAVCFALLRLNAARPVRTETFLRALSAGWNAFASRSWVWATVSAASVANAVFVGGIVVLGPALADKTIGRSAWGIFLAAQTLGYVAGGILAMRIRIRRMLTFGILCCTAWALPLFALAAHSPLPVLLAASFLGGVGVELFGVAWATSLQEQIPLAVLSRVSSYDQLGSFLAIPLGQVLAGPISAALGLTPTLAGGGTLLVLALGATLCLPSVRHLETSRGSE